MKLNAARRYINYTTCQLLQITQLHIQNVYYLLIFHELRVIPDILEISRNP